MSCFVGCTIVIRFVTGNIRKSTIVQWDVVVIFITDMSSSENNYKIEL